ncbi:hypothetical protein G6L30_08205 [Agrobacterium rhizogenes]|nr:hypothetical protein [Rhizobium rhizogenes]
MTSFQYRMPAGIPGDVSRDHAQATIEPGLFDASVPFPAYGLPAKLVAGKYQPFVGAEAATALVGLLVRPFPTSTNVYSGGLGTSVPPQDGTTIANILKRGYMSIQLNGGATVVKGGQVYIRVAAAAGGKPLGGFEGAADSTNTVAPAGLFFTGPADSNGNVEVAYNI